MNYKPVPTTCGCGKPRRPGQRDCKDCHAASARRLREEAKKAPAVETLSRAMRKVASPRGRKLEPEFEVKLRAMASRVAKELEQFNRAGAA